MTSYMYFCMSMYILLCKRNQNIHILEMLRQEIYK